MDLSTPCRYMSIQSLGVSSFPWRMWSELGIQAKESRLFGGRRVAIYWRGGGAEVFVVLAYIWSVVVFDETWWRFHYVLVSTVLVSVLALSMGPISWLLTNKLFEVFSRFEIEFYLFHQVIIKYVWILLPALSLSGTTMSAVVGLGLSIAVSCAYIVIAKRASRLLGAWRQRGLMRRDGSTQQK